MNIPLIIRDLGQQDYTTTWEKMRHYTDNRDANSPDEIWLLEHPPVFTQGQAGKAEHLLNPGDIPVIQVDRGGQVTYHGPGQLVAYILVDIKRRGIGVRNLVTAIEKAIIKALQHYGISSEARQDAPGVYVDEQKICSLGLRIRHGRSYHGLAFNINMDLEPFRRINPCGYSNITMTQLSQLSEVNSVAEVSPILVKYLTNEIEQMTTNRTNHEQPSTD